MNRELKFRIFSKIQNKMIYSQHAPYNIESIDFIYRASEIYVKVIFERTYNVLVTDKGYQGENPTLDGHWEGNKFYDHKDTEWVQGKDVMQYTGLNDKNGREIYEGDIVTHETLGTEGGKYIVKYCNGLHNIDPDIVSVIKIKGNICENPELLK